MSPFFQAVFYALLAAIFAEAVEYTLIYRTSQFKNLKSTIEKLNTKIEKLQSSGSKRKEKQLDHFQTQLTDASRRQAGLQMRSTIVVSVVLIGVFSFLSSKFAGVPVAKLPFVPFLLVSGLSHRGLEGDDMTEASAIFIYALSSIVFKSGLKKLLNFNIYIKGPSLWEQAAAGKL
ncbi:integral membrane protein DUF106-domain-containing protein [Paraphysoderma sedebokerense]|nr:integral membrane protein DUF106-domain-containing protein [Paraphysoderma sedebokerense]